MIGAEEGELFVDPEEALGATSLHPEGAGEALPPLVALSAFFQWSKLPSPLTTTFLPAFQPGAMVSLR